MSIEHQGRGRLTIIDSYSNARTPKRDSYYQVWSLVPCFGWSDVPFRCLSPYAVYGAGQCTSISNLKFQSSEGLHAG